MAASVTTSLPNGEKVSVATQATYVTDPIPTAYVTHADYKKVVVTVTRLSDNRVLAQNTTYVASASAPPLAGTGWVLIKRQVIDGVTTQPLVGASVNVTGGPNSANRTDTTDGSGTVLFPALDSSPVHPPPDYMVAATMTGYNVFPDDLPPMAPEQLGASPGANSTATIRMYLPTSVTINVQASNGAPYTGGATVSLQSSRCGVTSVSIPSGQSSTTITTCAWATGKTNSTRPEPPRTDAALRQVQRHGVVAISGGFWGGATPFTVPSNYPTTLSQTATVRFAATAYTTKTVKVTVTKGGSADTNARVNVTGAALGVYLYGTTDSNGQVTPHDPRHLDVEHLHGQRQRPGRDVTGRTSFSASTGSTSPITSTVPIS